MTGSISRRDVLLRAAALASASLSAAALAGIAAPLNKPVHSVEIDRALQARGDTQPGEFTEIRIVLPRSYLRKLEIGRET